MGGVSVPATRGTPGIAERFGKGLQKFHSRTEIADLVLVSAVAPADAIIRIQVANFGFAEKVFHDGWLAPLTGDCRVGVEVGSDERTVVLGQSNRRWNLVSAWCGVGEFRTGFGENGVEIFLCVGDEDLAGSHLAF